MLHPYKSFAVPDFLNKEAPPNYIAGLGRGASGFTTRSDIGPARDAGPEMDHAKWAAQQAAAAASAAAEEDDGRYQDPDNETGLFASAPYEADDEEADRIYEEIDRKMDERRRARREERERQELEEMYEGRPKIQQQFADLKRKLVDVTEEEWSSIPEVGDLVRKKNKKSGSKLSDKYTPIPDSVLLSAQRQTEYATSLDARLGIQTPINNNETTTDFTQFGQARDKVLSLKLDQVSDSVSGQTTIDPKGYLTDLNSIIVKTDAEISDIKKARTLLRSVTLTNPKHAPGWIAAARLEEVAGRHATAREIIAQGCEECQKSEDIWLEAARLNTPENAKIILANAVRFVPQSVKIWLKASEYETDVKSKKRVLRRSLEFIPNSVKIWKAAVSLEEDPEDAKILLSRAVECVPLSVELWLALARLETYDNAKKVINRARKAIPSSHEIWIAAVKLQEAQGEEEMVDKMMSRAVSDLSKKGCLLDREVWIKEAEACEKEGAVLTCQAIIRATVEMGVEEDDRKATWMEDAESCTARGCIQTARAIYGYALKVLPHKKSIWRRAAFFEKAHGTSESLAAILEKAVQHCPNAEVLWLMAAKEKWLSGDVDGAKKILEEASKPNPNSEQIWLAAIKLEVETGEYQRGRILLENARLKANTEKVWMKSAMLERQLKNFTEALVLLEQGLEKFPTFPKLWMIKGQIEDFDLNNIPAARETYSKAVKQCSKNVTLWILASRLEEKDGKLIKGRAILERARLLNPKEAELWCEAVRLETRGGNAAMAKALMAKALQECPSSGLLWSEAILMEARPQRKARSADALRKCENDPLILITVARLFWAERKIDKARNWFNRAVKIDSDLGDAWAWYLKFEMMHGDDSTKEDVIKRCIAAEPHHGEKWQSISKNMANIGMKTEDVLKLLSSELVNSL